MHGMRACAMRDSMFLFMFVTLWWLARTCVQQRGERSCGVLCSLSHQEKDTVTVFSNLYSSKMLITGLQGMRAMKAMRVTRVMKGLLQVRCL